MQIKTILAALAVTAITATGASAASSFVFDTQTRAHITSLGDVQKVHDRSYHRVYRYTKHKRKFYRRHGITYFNGYRGHRKWRHGYRHYRGYWFPHHAFEVRVIVRPSVPHRPVRPRIIDLNGSHYAWCSNRYRSYRASDNTFQPYHGPRRHCRSPYIR